MKVRLVTHVEPEIGQAVAEKAKEQSRTISQMLAVLIAKALAAEQHVVGGASRRPRASD